MGVEQFDQLGKVGQRSRQTVDLIDDDHIDFSGPDVHQQPLQVGSIG